MIRVRDDDVLRPSSDWKDREVERLKRIHSWITEFPNDFIHVPAIVVNEIQLYPAAVDFVAEETAAGRMLPEVHGLEHVDYGKLSAPEIVEHLEQCLEWFHTTLSVTPTRFYTPWGGMHPHVTDAAASVGLTAIGVDTHWMLEKVVARLRNGGLVEDVQGQEVFMHWWNRGIRLKRLAMIVSHGSYAAAAVAEDSKEFF
jgi:hypothetical protein